MLVIVLCRFNKREEDFPTLKEYNDYLEEVEDMSMLLLCFFFFFFFSDFCTLYFPCIFSINKKRDNSVTLSAFDLIEGIDVPAIEEKIARYQEENAEQIMINRARKVPGK